MLHDRMKVGGPEIAALLHLAEGGADGAAVGMSQDYHQPGSKVCGGVLDAPNLGGLCNVAGHALDS